MNWLAPRNGRVGGLVPSTEAQQARADLLSTTPSDAWDEGAEDTLAGESLRRLLLVSLQEEVVALPAELVVEVLPERIYAHIPGAPRPVAGVANRRGRMLTVVDLGVALGGAPTTAAGHRVVVVAFRGREIGLAVRDVLQFATDWWSQAQAEALEDEGMLAAVEEGSGAGGDLAAGSGGDEQLRVIEVESVLAPLFGGEDHGVGERSEGRT